MSESDKKYIRNRVIFFYDFQVRLAFFVSFLSVSRSLLTPFGGTNGAEKWSNSDRKPSSLFDVSRKHSPTSKSLIFEGPEPQIRTFRLSEVHYRHKWANFDFRRKSVILELKAVSFWHFSGVRKRWKIHPKSSVIFWRFSNAFGLHSGAFLVQKTSQNRGVF